MSNLAAEADYILKSEAFRTAISETEANITKEWGSGVLNTPEKRETAYYQLQAVKAVRSKLEIMIADMKVDAFNAAKKAKLDKPSNKS